MKHHVALSIVGTQRLVDSGYMRAKAAQEDLIKTSRHPVHDPAIDAVLRVHRTDRQGARSVGDVYHLSPALMQPIVSDDVVAALADIALGAPLNATVEIGGPEAIPLDELGREVLSAKGDPHQIVGGTGTPALLRRGAERPVAHPGPQGARRLARSSAIGFASRRRTKAPEA